MRKFIVIAINVSNNDCCICLLYVKFLSVIPVALYIKFGRNIDFNNLTPESLTPLSELVGNDFILRDFLL